MTVEKITFSGEGVSWTDKSIDYYIHRIDRTKMLAYFERSMNRVCRGEKWFAYLSLFNLCLLVVQINVLAAVAVLIYIPLLLATNNTAGGHVGRIHGGERRRDVG